MKRIVFLILILIISIAFSSCVTLEDCGRTTRMIEYDSYKYGPAYSTYNRPWLKPACNPKANPKPKKESKKEKNKH